MLEALIIDMKPVRIFQHIDCEGPGYFAETLAHYNIPYQIVRIDKGELPPTSINDISALVFMGGSMSANDKLPWIQQELELIRQAAEKGIPLLGHCLGGQLISKALGGRISANPVKEIGWLPVTTVGSATASEWLDNLPDENLLFHWHGETFSLPEGATLILESEHCAHQGFVMGNILALQCHVEMTAGMVREWVSRFPNELSPETNTVQGSQSILLDLDKKITAMQKVADSLYQQWLKTLTN